MTILHKLVNAAAGRLSLGHRDERKLIETVFRQLPQATYWRLREQGFAPGGIIDIGAHEGDWTRMIRDIFPYPPVLMIEARQEQEAALQRVRAELSHVKYVIALLGREPQAAVPFNVSGTGSSIFAERSDAERVLRQVPMRALDEVVAETELLGEPFFLKLDIQGAELECLRGGNAVLDKAEVVQLEVALLNYNEAAPLAPEVISFMDVRNFAMFDIAGFVRPNGVNLVQLDIIFVKKNSRLRPDFFEFKPAKQP
jgi:FkbM family methyltransferase